VPPATDRIAAWIGGFVAAEGCFTKTSSPGKRRFLFQVGLGSADTSTCLLLKEVLGVGRLVTYGRRQPHYDDEVTLVVTRLRDLIEVVVPFMDAHLPASHKRIQYERWRAELLGYWDTQARRRRPCSMAGCAAPSLAHLLCRITSGPRRAGDQTIEVSQTPSDPTSSLRSQPQPPKKAPGSSEPRRRDQGWV